MEIDVPLKKREDALKKREDAKLERIDWSCVIARRLKNLEISEELIGTSKEAAQEADSIETSIGSDAREKLGLITPAYLCGEAEQHAILERSVLFREHERSHEREVVERHGIPIKESVDVVKERESL